MKFHLTLMPIAGKRGPRITQQCGSALAVPRKGEYVTDTFGDEFVVKDVRWTFTEEITNVMVLIDSTDR